MKMKLIDLLLTATLLVGCYAQQTAPEPTPKPSPLSTDADNPPKISDTGPKTHTIDIGADGPWTIQPNRTDAAVGDILEWRFHSGEHWIIRGIHEHPCIPREYIFEDLKPMSSGPMEVDEESDEVQFFRAKVNDSEPILFYSGAEGACVDHKMLGIVNPKRNVNLVNHKSRAKDVIFQLRPGDPWPEDEKLPSTTASNIPTATSTDDPTEETSAPPASDDNGDSDNGLSTGAIAGMAVGATLALIIFGLTIFYCGRRGGVKIFFNKEHSNSPALTPVRAAAPFAPSRPPRTPYTNTENWRPTQEYQSVPGSSAVGSQRPTYHDHARESSTGNWRPTGQYQGVQVPRSVGTERGPTPHYQQADTVSRTMSPAAPMYQQTIPVASPYKTGKGSQEYMSAGMPTPPAVHEPRHISSFYDPHQRSAGSGIPSTMDVQYSRVSAAPIELPTSSDPGNSPLPQYQPGGHGGRPQARKFSWSGTGHDTLFRTSNVI